MYKRYPEITIESNFWDIDEALYQFERPLYRYSASGAGCNPSTEYSGWDEERERLSKLWDAKCTYGGHLTLPKNPGFIETILNFFK